MLYDLGPFETRCKFIVLVSTKPTLSKDVIFKTENIPKPLAGKPASN
jgi:hypothetical protein